MIQTRHGRRLTTGTLTTTPSPSVQIRSNPDGSVCLISGSTKFTVSETPVTVDVNPEPTSPRCLTRAQSRLKMDAVSPPKTPEKSTMTMSPRSGDKTSSPNKSVVRSVFICFFCKHEFHSRGELIKHQDNCGSVPNGLRKHELPNSKPETRSLKRHPDLGARSVISNETEMKVKLKVQDIKVATFETGKRHKPEADGDWLPPDELANKIRLDRKLSRSDTTVDLDKSKSPEQLKPLAKSPIRQIASPRFALVQRVKVEARSPNRPGPKCSKVRSPERSRLAAVRVTNEESEIRARPAVRRSLIRPSVSKDKYTSSLQLIPVTKVKDMTQERHHNEIIEIDLTDETDVLAPKSPRTPATPRTLKSLLSFDSSQTQLNKSERAYDEGLSSDSDGDGKPRPNSHHYHFPTNKTLLSIGLSSNLGQKLNHLVNEAVERTHREQDYEQFCRTPIKSSFQDRLRFRDNHFPLTFKKNKHHRSHYHVYKFTKKQRSDFMKTGTTGLSRRSRHIYRSLPKCTVKLKRLTNRDVKRLSKVKPKPKMRTSMYGEIQWRQPNILRRVPAKLVANQLAAKSAFAAALLRSPSRLETIPCISRLAGSARPVGVFLNYNGQQPLIQQQFQQRQNGFAWHQENPKRAIAQVSPIMKPGHTVVPTKQQARVAPMSRPAPDNNVDKMVEERIDDDISIVVPVNDCITLSSDSDDSPRQKGKRPLVNASMPAPKLARLHHPIPANKSYTAPLTELASPAKRVITAAVNAASEDDRTFLFRCHLCGLEERHRIAQSKDIYKHLHSNHRGEVIHIVDYKLHGEVHLVEAMSKPPTVMKTAPEVAKCSNDVTGLDHSGKRTAKNAQKTKAPDLVICLDD